MHLRIVEMPRHAQDGPSATPHLGTQHKSIRLPLGSVTRIDAVEMVTGSLIPEACGKPYCRVPEMQLLST